MAIPQPSRLRRLLPWAVLLLGLAVTAGCWALVRKAEQARIQGAFEAAVSARMGMITQRMVTEEQILKGAAEFVSQQGRMSRWAWRDYVSALELPRRYPGIQGLGYARWIRRGDLGAHDLQARAEGFPDYRVRTLGEGPADPGGAGAVVFLEPMDERNVRALGLDVWSEPARREALIRARDLGVVAATRPLRLVQDDLPDHQAGVILYAPVYRHGAPLDTVSDRRGALLGWTNLALRMDDHLQGILGPMPEGLRFQISDEAGASPIQIFPSGATLVAELEKTWQGARLTRGRSVEAAGRRWRVQAQADGRFTAARGEGAHWTFLAAGAMASLLAFLAFVAMARSEARAERLAERRLNQLVSSEARYAAVVDSLSEGLLVYDEGGRIRACNPAAEDILGLDHRDLIGAGFTGEGWRVVDEAGDPLPLDQHPVAAALRTGKAQKRATFGLISPGGRFRWLQSSVTPILGTADSRRFSVVATVLDITEQRKAELALKEAEGTFRNLFEQSPNAVSITQAEDGVILDVNDAWCRLFGRSRDAVLGRRQQDLKLYEPPEAWGDLVKAVASDPILDATPMTILRKDGTRLHASLGVATMAHQGRPCLLAVHQDHTRSREAEQALRDSEARWKFAIEGAGDGLWDWDVIAGQVYFSPRWKAMLGHGETEIGDTLQEWESRVHPEDLAAVQRALRRHLAGETATYQSEHRLKCKDGTYKWILDRGMVVLRTADGLPARVIGTHSDLTERRNAEAALREAHKAEGLGLMAAGIAHDFNNLFQSLLGNLELAHLRSDPAGRRIIDRARHSLDKASGLSRRLLEFSGGSFTHLGTLSVNALIQSVADAHSSKGPAQPLLVLDPKVPEVVADPQQLRQILDILLENALEAVAARGGGVTLASEWMPALPEQDQAQGLWAGEVPAGPLVRITIADTGGGAGPDVMNHLFDPFFSTKALGRGLGLPSALGLIRGNRAGLQVVDQPGTGMTFRIYLSGEHRDVRRDRRPAAPQSVRGQAVLVVDDEMELRQVLCEALRECHGCPVFEAADGVEAVEVFQAHRDEIGLVLMDSVMPRMKGPEAFDEIRRISPGVPGILISGFSEGMGQDLALQHGFSAFLKKPFPLKHLLDLMAEVQSSPGDGGEPRGTYS